jgi:hypothetical protein
MSNRMWENTVEHAKTCVLGEKLYIYYTDETQSTGIVFNHIYELRGLIADGQFLALELLSHSQKVGFSSFLWNVDHHKTSINLARLIYNMHSSYIMCT